MTLVIALCVDYFAHKKDKRVMDRSHVRFAARCCAALLKRFLRFYQRSAAARSEAYA